MKQGKWRQIQRVAQGGNVPNLFRGPYHPQQANPNPKTQSMVLDGTFDTACGA
jgi:hypothetical protein